MKKHQFIYVLFIVQGVLSLSILLALLFVLPHRFSAALSHYIMLAPMIRNYYCATLLVSGLLGIFSIVVLKDHFRHDALNTSFLICIPISILYGLLIYPLVEAFYQTQTGVIQESIVLYRNALMFLSYYLLGHVVLGILSAFCLSKKQLKKKQLAIFFLALILGVVPAGFMSYQRYYEFEEVSLTEQLNYRFVGSNGQGKLEVISNDHPIQSLFPQFMSSLQYEVLENGKLSNGQQVAITVKYDPEEAKDLHLNIIEAVEKVEVSGLREYYSDYASIPAKIVQEAQSVAQSYMETKVAEALPGKETQLKPITSYYVIDESTQTHSLVLLYHISYMYDNHTYYYYRACHVNEIHSDALKNLELLTPQVDSLTYKSSLCEQGVNDLSSAEAIAHLNALLMREYDFFEQIQ